MKYLYCFYLVVSGMLISAGSAFSANELFRSISSGNWNSTSTWEMSTNGGGAWFAATSVPHDTSGATTVRSPNTVTVTVSTTSNQLTIDGGGTLTINTGIVLTTPNGTGNEVTVSPAGILNGAGTIRTQGAGVGINLRLGSAFSAQLHVNTGTADVYDQSSPFDGHLFGNLTIDSGATVNGGPVSGRSLTMYGSVTNNGSLVATSTGGALGMRGPSLVNNGTINSGGGFYFDSVTTVSGSGAFTSAIQDINANGNITLMSNVTFSPSSGMNVQTGGDLNLNGYVLTFNAGQFAAYSGATVNAPGTFRTQGTVTVYPVNGSNFNANFNVNTGSSTGGNTGSPDIFYGNVTIDAGATMNCGWTSGRGTAFYGNVTINGTWTASSTGGYIAMRGPAIVNNGTINAAGNFYFDTTTTVSGAGAFTSANQWIVPNGKVTLLSNVTFTPSANLTMQANGAVLNLNGFTMTFNSGAFILNANDTVNGPGTVRTQNDVGIYTGNSSAFKGDIKVNTGSLTSGTTAPDRIFGNVTIDNGTTYNCGWSSGRRTDFYGSITNNGTLTATSTGGIIVIKGPSFVNNGTVGLASGNFYFDSTTSFSGTGSFTTHANFTVKANVTATSGHQLWSFTIDAGGTFNIANRLIKVNGAPTPIVRNGTLTTTGSTIEYNGTAAQNVVPSITYGNLKINNSAGTFLLNSTSVNDTVIMPLGKLNLNGFILTISPTGYLAETPGNVCYGTGGWVTTTRLLNAPSSLNVGGLGAVLTSSASLGSTEVRRGHAVQTGAFLGTSIQRYFDIIPANNTGLNATLRFKYDESEIGGSNENLLTLFSSTNSGTNWTSRGGAPDASNNQITINNLNSFSRWTASTNNATAIIGVSIQGFYNANTNRMNQKDTMRVYLRNASAPYNIVDSAKNTIDSVLLNVQVVFPNITPGTYYIQLKHRNSLETWSKSGGETYAAFTTLNYDFTTSAANAYGSNQIQIDPTPLRFGIYSGDVDQDGVIGLSDITLTYNSASTFESGYKKTDLNGDNIVDLTDVTICFNNSSNFVSKVTP